MRGLVLLVALVGCKKGVIGGECDEDAPTLGSAGAFAHEVFDFKYRKGLVSGIAIGDAMSFRVPDDVSSLSVTVESPGLYTGFAYFALGDEVYADASLPTGDPGAWASEPYYHWALPGGTIAMPITPDTQPSAGCLVVQPGALGRQARVPGNVHIVTRRYEPTTPTVDLNIGILEGVTLSETDLDAALVRADAVWSGGGGPALGDVRIVDVPWDSAFITYDESNDLRSTPLGGPDQSVNLFIVQDYSDEEGTLGEAGGIPGPLGVQGVDGSAVIVAVDGHTWFSGTVDTRIMGETIAHEVGHQLGLYHTTESDGSTLESLDDTPHCPATADDGDGYFSAEECAGYDGPNFMFWVTGENMNQDVVSASQAMVLTRSPVAR